MDKHHCHSPLTEARAKEILADHGLNRTRGKVRILQEISRSQIPISVTEIHEKMGESCDVSTIFRTVSQLRDKNVIHEVNLEEGFFRYEYAPRENHHHHHVRCRNCGDIQNIEKCDLALFEKAIAKLGFKQMEHRLEFTGICSKCQRS
jgi:Fur family ferric uptake transcriptional regulator